MIDKLRDSKSNVGWWHQRSEKFRQTVVIAVIGTLPGLLAGSAAFLKKDDDQTARDVYSVLVKLIERVSVEQDTTQRNVEALHTQVAALSKQVDALSRQIEGVSTPPALSAQPLLPTRRTQIRVFETPRVSGKDAPAGAAVDPVPPPAPADSDVGVDMPAAWPE